MNAALLATPVAAVVGVGHWFAHRTFGDEVYNSKAGVGKATVVVTGLAWFAVYVAAGGGALLAPLEAFWNGLAALVEAVAGGLGL